MINRTVGWVLILAGFMSGSALGLHFHRDDFLGGYSSFRRRIVRLGHIALVALGMINVLYGLSFPLSDGSTEARVASIGFILGGVSMPAVCFLTGWKNYFRYLFFIPVASLLVATISTLLRSSP